MQPSENNTEIQKVEVETTEPQVQKPVQVVEPESQEQINWKKFREQREIERKQKDAAEKKAIEKEAEAQALKAAMDAILNKQSSNQVQHSNQYQEQEEESEDQRIQKKVDAALMARERSMEEQRIKSEIVNLPNKLAESYKDFNEVCSVENLDYLEYHYPEVAEAFKDRPDSFKKWEAVYKAVKRFVANPNSNKEQKKAEKNFNKPQSMAVSGATQTSDGAPMILDDKRRSDNWSRMQKVMKGGR